MTPFVNVTDQPQNTQFENFSHPMTVLAIFCHSTIQIFPYPATKWHRDSSYMFWHFFSFFSFKYSLFGNLASNGPYSVDFAQIRPMASILIDFVLDDPIFQVVY